MRNYVLRKSINIALAITFIGMLSGINSAWAAPSCTNANFKGTYGYSEQGKSGTVEIAEAGFMSANGKGELSATAQAIWSPLPLPAPFEQPLTLVFSTTGPGEGYTVKTDCSGDAIFSVTVTDKNNLPVPVGPAGSNIIPNRTIHFVISKSEIKFVSTTPGTVATGAATKQ